MGLKAGFAEVDITPQLGTRKIGWLKEIIGDTVHSPLFARVAVFRNGDRQVAVVQLDTLFIAWPEVDAIRQEVVQRYGFPGESVMVAATHNHAGPAITHAGDVRKDEAYAAELVGKVVSAFGEALETLQPAELGIGHAYEWEVAHNRRVVMRDGTVKTHGTFEDPDALYLEGPIDPEVAVIGVRDLEGHWLGAVINFACHPTHHGGDTVIDAGYPGVLALAMRAWGCPTTLFLNGTAGNMHTSDPEAGGEGMSAEAAGLALAEDAQQVMVGLAFERDVALGVASRTIDLPYRALSEEEIEGAAHGAQRFIDSAIYDRQIPPLLEKIKARGGVHRAEIQALRLGDAAVVALPGEIFVEFGLQIKEGAYPIHALAVSCANGRVGYVPTPEAFRRGGYETTFGPGSMLAPEAGEMMVTTALELIASVVGSKEI